MTGERLIGNRLAYINNTPKRYDIVIFRWPDDRDTYFIKRIIGLPGETIDIQYGNVMVTTTDGQTITLKNDMCPEIMVGSFGPFTVPANHYFMLGDNRNNSKDSRYWEHPYVPDSDILAKAEIVYWPVTKIRKLQ